MSRSACPLDGSVARGVEGSLDVVDLPGAVGVHLTRDDVEAGAGEGVAAPAQPRVGSRDESRPFALVHGPERVPEAVSAPSLHLDEHHEPTPAEAHLWQRLRNRRVQGAKFRRQHAIGRFIVDFYCVEVRLIVEVDGAIHEYTSEEDAIRQEYLESLGLRVLRFSNGQVMQQTDAVAERIGEVLQALR